MRPVLRVTIMMLILLSTKTKGQTYFEGLYGDVPSGQGVGGTVQVEHGYLNWCYSYGNLMSYMFITDMDGNLQLDSFFEKPDSISYLGSQLYKLSDTIFIGMTLIENLNLPSLERGDYGLIRFGISGQVLSEWIYGESDQRDIPQHFIRTSDGGYLISGQTQFDAPPDTDGQVYAVKIDSVGNVEWEQTYGGNLYDSGGGGIQTPDGGFLILGWTRSFGAGQRDFYLVKTDSVGNEEWFETYGTSVEEIGKSILLLTDGNYLLTGSGTNPQGTESLGRIYKIEPNGDIIWSKTYAYPGNWGNNFHRTIELWNGDLVSTGLTDLNSNSGWLVRTNNLGEVLWQREYDKNEYTDLFYSILQTEDGGFLLSGQAINEQTMSQDAWLLKVDSIGCTYPNCTVGIDELGSREIMVDVWPNPCTDVLNIEIAGSVEKIELQVYDVSGKRIMSQVQNTERGTIDVSNWASGIYILRGTDNREKTFSMKIVVE